MRRAGSSSTGTATSSRRRPRRGRGRNRTGAPPASKLDGPTVTDHPNQVEVLNAGGSVGDTSPLGGAELVDITAREHHPPRDAVQQGQRVPARDRSAFCRRLLQLERRARTGRAGRSPTLARVRLGPAWPATSHTRSAGCPANRAVGRVSITLPTDAHRVRDSGLCPGRDSNARPTA
jgi:hypothetical protein